MTLQVGMPVRIRDGSGNIRGGFIAGLDGNGNPQMVWANPNNNPPTWASGVITIRDDTGQQNNSWALVNIVVTASAQFEGV